MTDYTIMHAPRIRPETFRAVLARADSPAAGSAGAVYRGCAEYGVDPAILLAVFLHESGYGRAGVARFSRSWGNLRSSPIAPTVDGFARYASWRDGGVDTARLLRVYGLNRIRPGRDTSTARLFPYVWAPAGDGGNRPATYGDAIVRAVTAYRALDRRLDEPTHPTHKSPYRDVRLRRRPSTAAAIVDTLRAAGVTVRASGTVDGTRYELPDGRHGRRWLRIVAVNGHRLGDPVYSAALLWRAL